MALDESLIAYAVNYDRGMVDLQRAGISKDHFVDEYRTVWAYLLRQKRDHDALPSADTLCARFPDLSLPRVQRREVPILVSDAVQRYKFIQLLHAINRVADDAVNYDVVDEVIQTLQGDLNTLAFSGQQGDHLVDLFGAKGKKRMLRDAQARRRGGTIGIPTGLTKFDTICGGLQTQKMYVAIGRPGIGKSWLDILMVAMAVISGKSVILYPLEMTLEETAHRLYTVFTSKMFGPQRALKNYDLSMGRVSKAKMVRFLNALEDRFKGQLLVADVGSLADPYTVERIEAEVEMHHPDMFWVDYLTLLKPPKQGGGMDDGWASVKTLSNGIKNTAMRRRCVGGCSAQVNREALKNPNIFLPRLEHIAYGDSIGQDADGVFSLNRRRGKLYYALVKHRGGPEIGKTAMTFGVNVGVLEEEREQPEESEEAS